MKRSFSFLVCMALFVSAIVIDCKAQSLPSELDYDIVTDISKYSKRTYPEVFNIADNSWYMLNSNNEYEKYGVVEELPTSYKWMTLTSSVASDSHEAKDFNGRLAFRSLRITPDNSDKEGYIYLSQVQQGQKGTSEEDEDYYIHTGTNGNFSLKRLYPGRYIYTKSFTYDVKESQEFTKDGDRYVYTFDQNMYFSHVSGANARISTVEVLVPNFDDVTTYEGKIVVMSDSLFRFDDGQWHTIGANKKGWVDLSHDLDTTVLISSMRIDMGQSVGYGMCWVVFKNAEGLFFLATPYDGCVLPNNRESSSGTRTRIASHPKVEGTENTYQIDFSLYDRAPSHKFTTNYNYACYTTQVYLEDYPATYPEKEIPEEVQNGTFVESEPENNVDDKELHITTFVVDGDAQPIYAGGYIHHFDKDEIARKGLIVSKRDDDMVITDDTKFYELKYNYESHFYDDSYPIDFRVIDCTCINEEEYVCPLAYFLGNTDYFVRAFAVTNDNLIIYGNIEQIHTLSFNRKTGVEHDYANVWYAFSYTLFDLVTDEIIDPTNGFYYSTNENPKSVRYQTGTNYNTCYKFATEWNYKLWYYHNSNHSDKNKMVSRPVMKYVNGKVEISKAEADADKDITIFYSIDENGNRPENFTQVYSEPLAINQNSIVYCYAISSDGYMSYTNMYVIKEPIVPVNDSQEKVAEVVDLGLSVKWASWNLGASTPEDYGYYFGWGETAPKKEYDWDTYKFGKPSNFTKYNSSDRLVQLELEDDAAYVLWGKDWRMPTHEEELELANKCSWTSVEINGISGYKITGPNGNSIFMPRGGLYDATDYGTNDNAIYVNSHGWYWSSTLNSTGSSFAQGLCFYPSLLSSVSDHERCDGHNIRPVYVGPNSIKTFINKDGVALSIAEQKAYDVVIYTRTFSSADKWQALYVPFSIPYDTLAKYGLQVAELNNIHMYDTDDDGDFDQTTLEFLNLKRGATEPNYPYLIKAATAGDVTLAMTDVEVKATEETEIECSSTRKRFKVKGTYAGVSGAVMYANNYYAMGGGTLVRMANADSGLKPQRWYLSVENKDGSPAESLAATMRITIDGIEIEEDVTAISEVNAIGQKQDEIYMLDGRKLNGTAALKSGLYVKNHKKLFVR